MSYCAKEGGNESAFLNEATFRANRSESESEDVNGNAIEIATVISNVIVTVTRNVTVKKNESPFLCVAAFQAFARQGP